DLDERAGFEPRKLRYSLAGSSASLDVVSVFELSVVDVFEVVELGVVEVVGLVAGVCPVFSVWNLSHTPTLRSRFATESEGCAPLRSQSSARSSSISINEGSSRGLYFPMISMNLPSRGLR